MRFIIINCKTTCKKIGPLSVLEFNAAETKYLKIMQSLEFSEEITSLSNKVSLKNSSKLLNLNTFIDKEGLLRVCGRIQRANIQYSQKHPIIKQLFDTTLDQ